MRIWVELDFPEAKTFQELRQELLLVLNTGKDHAIVNCNIVNFKREESPNKLSRRKK